MTSSHDVFAGGANTTDEGVPAMEDSNRAVYRGPSDRIRVLIGRSFAVIAVGLGVVGIVLLAIIGGWEFLIDSLAFNFGALAVMLGVLTWLMIPAQSRNGSVWALAWAGLFAALFASGVASSVAITKSSIPDLTYEAFRRLSIAELPGMASWFVTARFWAVVPAFWLPLTVGLLMFPDGQPPTRRWRWVGWWSLTAIAVGTIATAIAQNPWSTLPISSGEGTVPGPIGQWIDAGFALATLSAVVCVASLFVRYRRSEGIARSQIRSIAFGGSIYVAALVVGGNLALPPLLDAVGGVVTPSALVVAYGIAILKYRLYDIDVVISKTVTYGALAAFITGVYALVVAGVGSFVGGGDEPSLVLSIGAVAIVAVAFEPLRRRIQHWANVLVYGRRATPYEVLARFSHRAAEESDQDVLARIPRLIVDGTGASQAALWVRSGDGFRTASVWPDASPGRRISVVEFNDPEADVSLPVFHNGELLGGISLQSARGGTITPPERELVVNLAGGMGLTLRNNQLTSELRRQVKDLQRSRDRVVSAADEARRSLEHDLDSGPQQQLVAVKVKLGPVRMLAEQAGAERTAGVLADIESQAGDAIQAVRDFAAGIYPPLLGADGLAVALAQETRRAAVPVELVTEGIGRYPRDVESAVYFSILEALQNTAKYAEASRAVVKLSERDGDLTFEISDDGVGFDPAAIERGAGLDGIGDRIDTVGGVWTIRSVPCGGTVVSGSVPVRDSVSAWDGSARRPPFGDDVSPRTGFET